MKCGLRQRHEAILVALGIADVHASAHGIDVADLQPQSQAEEGEKEYPVAEHAGGGEYPFGFVNRDDVRQALAPGRLDQTGSDPGLAQDMLGVELQTVQVEFDGALGVRRQEFAEVVRQLRFGQVVDLMIEARADAADGA